MMCRGIHCPNRKQCKLWVKNYPSLNKDEEIINKCLNLRKFVRNG